MSLLDFGTIMKYFSDETTDEDRRELFKEVALMVLARATSSDTNIRCVEVTSVQQVLKVQKVQQVTTEILSGYRVALTYTTTAATWVLVLRVLAFTESSHCFKQQTQAGAVWRL